MKSQNFYTYILTNKTKTTLYIGCTNNLERRLMEHKTDDHGSKFVRRYHLDYLVYYEVYTNMADAIAREKQIKGWRRQRKNELISVLNPEWSDLTPQ